MSMNTNSTNHRAAASLFISFLLSDMVSCCPFSCQALCIGITLKPHELMMRAHPPQFRPGGSALRDAGIFNSFRISCRRPLKFPEACIQNGYKKRVRVCQLHWERFVLGTWFVFNHHNFSRRYRNGYIVSFVVLSLRCTVDNKRRGHIHRYLREIRFAQGTFDLS